MNVNEQKTPPVALTVAGFDPSGGAGVVADVKTFTAFGCFAAAAVTSLTYQNTTGVFREADLPAPVVDPVVRSTSGYDLIDDAALAALRDELLPLARVLTPNIPEAERITGMLIRDRGAMAEAARLIRGMGARAVLVKGG